MYNDGWELEEYDLEDFEYEVLKSTVTEEDAREYVDAEYSDVYDEIWLSNRNTDLSSEFSSDEFEFTGSYSDGYIKKYEKIIVRFDFESLSWRFSYMDVDDSYEEWNVLGKWTYSSEDGNVTVIIHEINDDYISLEYDFSYKYDTVLAEETIEELSSDGIETREKLLMGFDGDAIGCEFRGRYDEYIRIEKDGIRFYGKDGNWGIDRFVPDLIYQGE